MNGIRLLVFVILLVSLPLPVSSTSSSDFVISSDITYPNAVSEINGNRFEIDNKTGNALDLIELTLSEYGSNTHITDNNGSPNINPNDYMPFERDGDYTDEYINSGFVMCSSSNGIAIEITAWRLSGLNTLMALLRWERSGS